MPALLLIQVGRQLLYALIALTGFAISMCSHFIHHFSSAWMTAFQELIKEINVPAVFSDYCEEACHLAASCITTLTGCPLSVPVCPHCFFVILMLLKW